MNLDLSDTKIVAVLVAQEFIYMFSSLSHLILLIVLLSCPILSYASAEVSLNSNDLLKKMEAAYARVEDYQMNVEVKNYKSDGSSEIQKFLYTFKKPKWIRIDFESPHSGMILIYPDKNGKVRVEPPGLARTFKFDLSPENPLLRTPSGQRVDQTSLELLIQNISHSLTDQRRGPAHIDENAHVRIRVLATNHFRKGIVTLYQFFIDKHLWLPVEVEESTPEGQLERSIVFQHLRINTGVPASFVKMD